MTKLSERDLQKVQRALSFTYQQRDEMVTGDGWQNRVMARLGNSEISASPFGFMALVEQYFWRLTPLAAMVMLVLGIVLYQQINTFSDYETARVFMGNTFDNPLSRLLGSS